MRQGVSDPVDSRPCVYGGWLYVETVIVPTDLELPASVALITEHCVTHVVLRS